eukprot:TRINITY_DN10336_c0_g2_i2.p1 TRINITY_DN10336_c0_g2~~TRINITY_DN10336_c0_g2_i2.p1  ORF type:complete len:180 (+),score=48.65 TRINITY_DN10336_c0_g2_i2:176-715(+)
MSESLKPEDVSYRTFEKGEDVEPIIKMIETELSEPYSIFTYRYFLLNWPHLAFLAYIQGEMIGAIIGKLEKSEKHSGRNRAYIAMLVVRKEYRKLKIGSALVQKFIEAVKAAGCDDVVLETEAVNKPALKLYESLGFAREKRLLNYYMNGNDAFRLKLWLTGPSTGAGERTGPEEEKKE